MGNLKPSWKHVQSNVGKFWVRRNPLIRIAFLAVLGTSGSSAVYSAPVVAPSPASVPVPPTLPQAKVDLTMPIQSGTVRNVEAGNAAAFQAAINAATCGDTIVLAAGSTYSGSFTIPNKTCSGWILIQSSALESLHAAGTRVGPSNAANMAKIVTTATDTSAIAFQTSSHNWRLMGLEVTSTAGLHETSLIETFVSAAQVAQEPSFVIIDRCYVHGALTSAIRRGFSLQGPSMAVVDSYFSEFHDQVSAPGQGADSQAIASWDSPGPVLVQNNFLSGASENLLFGGADPSIANLVPSDITVVGNWFWKDRANWLNAGMVVKNLVEFKDAQRVLLDGNVLEYSWVDAQVGFALLLTVRNDGGQCTWCVVQDVTVTHNLIRHAASGISTTGADDLQRSLPDNRILIQNNVLTDISSATYGGDGRGIMSLTSGGLTTMSANNIEIDHNDVFASNVFLYLGDSGTIANYQLTNNIATYGLYGIIGTNQGVGSSSLNYYLPTIIFNKQVMITSTGSSDGNTWPSGTFWNSTSGTEFTNYGGGNYQLTNASTYRNAGTDGKDIGVWDWTTFNAETNNALNGNYPALSSKSPAIPSTPPTPPPSLSIIQVK
jgi:hypothetical protein